MDVDFLVHRARKNLEVDKQTLVAANPLLGGSERDARQGTPSRRRPVSQVEQSRPQDAEPTSRDRKQPRGEAGHRRQHDDTDDYDRRLEERRGAERAYRQRSALPEDYNEGSPQQPRREHGGQHGALTRVRFEDDILNTDDLDDLSLDELEAVLRRRRRLRERQFGPGYGMQGMGRPAYDADYDDADDYAPRRMGSRRALERDRDRDLDEDRFDDGGRSGRSQWSRDGHSHVPRPPSSGRRRPRSGRDRQPRPQEEQGRPSSRVDHDSDVKPSALTGGIFGAPSAQDKKAQYAAELQRQIEEKQKRSGRGQSRSRDRDADGKEEYVSFLDLNRHSGGPGSTDRRRQQPASRSDQQRGDRPSSRRGRDERRVQFDDDDDDTRDRGMSRRRGPEGSRPVSTGFPASYYNMPPPSQGLGYGMPYGAPPFMDPMMMAGGMMPFYGQQPWSAMMGPGAGMPAAADGGAFGPGPTAGYPLDYQGSGGYSSQPDAALRAELNGRSDKQPPSSRLNDFEERGKMQQSPAVDPYSQRADSRHQHARGAEPGVGPKSQSKKSYAEELQEQMRIKKEKEAQAKREQEAWEKKKEREIAEYNPWGRGGAGAPVTKENPGVRGGAPAQPPGAGQAQVQTGADGVGSAAVSDRKTAAAREEGGYFNAGAMGKAGKITSIAQPNEEERKRKQIELQEELRRQVEEKERQKREEAERIRREEELEAQRIREEQERLAKAYEEELRQQKEKEAAKRREEEELKQKRMEAQRKQAEAAEKARREREEQERQEAERRLQQQLKQGRDGSSTDDQARYRSDSPPIPTMAGKMGAGSAAKEQRPQSPPIPTMRGNAGGAVSVDNTSNFEADRPPSRKRPDSRRVNSRSRARAEPHERDGHEAEEYQRPPSRRGAASRERHRDVRPSSRGRRHDDDGYSQHRNHWQDKGASSSTRHDRDDRGGYLDPRYRQPSNGMASTPQKTLSAVSNLKKKLQEERQRVEMELDREADLMERMKLATKLRHRQLSREGARQPASSAAAPSDIFQRILASQSQRPSSSTRPLSSSSRRDPAASDRLEDAQKRPNVAPSSSATTAAGSEDLVAKFNRFKYTNFENDPAKRKLLEMYPEPATDAASADKQQRAYLQQQEAELDRVKGGAQDATGQTPADNADGQRSQGAMVARVRPSSAAGSRSIASVAEVNAASMAAAAEAKLLQLNGERKQGRINGSAELQGRRQSDADRILDAFMAKAASGSMGNSGQAADISSSSQTRPRPNDALDADGDDVSLDADSSFQPVK